MSASTCLSLSCVLSVDAFNDKILTYLRYHKLFYKNYNNNNDDNNKNKNKNSNNNNDNNNNNKRNVFGVLQKKPQDIIVNMHVFVRNASW